MNDLIFKTNQKVIEMCMNKMDKYLLQYYKHLFSSLFGKRNKEFNYYHSLANRILKDTTEYQERERR